MKVTVEDISSIKKRMDIVIPQEKVSGDIDEAYNVLRKTASIKGFRPGKVPRNILERLYRDRVESEVATKLISDAYPRAIEEQNLAPIGMPAIEKGELSYKNDFTFSVTLEIAPQIEPHDYMGMDLEKEEMNITEAMIEERMEQIRNAHAKLQAVLEDRPLKEGDMAVVNYQAYEHEKPLSKLANENFPILLGENRFNPDIEQGLIGAKRDEEKSIEVAFPPEFDNPIVAGKTVLFKIKVLDIKEKILPDLDDEFVRDLGGDLQTLEELKARVREQITEEETRRIERNLHDQVHKKLIESHDFEVPQGLVEIQSRKMMNELENNLRQKGLNFESAGIVPADVAENYRGIAEKQVKGSLLFKSIAEKESLAVGDSEIDEALEKVAAQVGQSKEVIADFYHHNNAMENLRAQLLEEKTLKFIVEAAKITLYTPESKKSE